MPAPKHSPRLRARSRLGLWLVAAALVVTLLAGWYASSQTIAALDHTKLQSYQSSLHSYAAESMLLADQARQGRTTAMYTTTAAHTLYQAVDDIRLNLQTEDPEPSIAKQAGVTEQQAERLADALSTLAQSPSQRELAGLVHTLDGLQRELPAQ